MFDAVAVNGDESVLRVKKRLELPLDNGTITQVTIFKGTKVTTQRD